MYMTGDEIRALSRRIPAVCNATDEELSFWMDDAFDVLNNFVQQDFVYERQATKRVRATTNTLVYLPKVLSGLVTVVDCLSGDTIAVIDSSTCQTFAGLGSAVGGGLFTDAGSGNVSTTGGPIEVFPGNFVLGYYTGNIKLRAPNARLLDVTGDWGFIGTKEELLSLGLNDLLAAYEAHRQDALVHIIADVNNAVTSPPATTDLTSILALVNELRLDINAHMGDLIVHQADDPDITLLPAATDLETAIDLFKDLVNKYNLHLGRGGSATDPHAFADTDNTVSVSLDFEGPIMPRVIRRVFLRLVQRIAIRDDAEDHRQLNSPYTSETLGDGYSYDLGNGTLRNLIRPEEAHMLLPFVNRGRVVI